MGGKTIISWTDHTFNIVIGCAKVSEGCAHCYAQKKAKQMGSNLWGIGADRMVLGNDYWKKPFAWQRKAQQLGQKAKVFCGSMCDVFEDHPTVAHERERLWHLIEQTPDLIWQLLTKRPEQMLKTWPGSLPNVWLGVSIENVKRCYRANLLRQANATIRFISYEPALDDISNDLCLEGIDWLIYGGESGPGFRPDNDEWARRIMRRCKESRAAFWYKQASGPHTEYKTTLDGEAMREYPEFNQEASTRCLC